MNNKSELNTFYSKVTRRMITKGDICYVTNPVDGGGWRSQLQLPGLPEPLNQTTWAGDVCSKKQDAEQSVAGTALLTLLSDETLAAKFAEPSKPASSGKGKGKGKGKFKGRKNQDMSSSQSLLAAAAQDSALWTEAFAAAMAASGYSADSLSTGDAFSVDVQNELAWRSIISSIS